MWRAGLAFTFQRLLLFFAALYFINLRLAPHTAFFPSSLLSFATLQTELLQKVSASPEVVALKELAIFPALDVFKVSQNPFMWLGHFLYKGLHIPNVVAAILLSNVFFLLFVSEAHALLSRIITSEVSVATSILIVLWPTSYEMSLGSQVSLVCWLVMVAVRHAMEDKWTIAGLALGFLALVDPVAIGIMPLLIYIFWYFQRHFPWNNRVRKAILLLGPLALAIFWRWDEYRSLPQVIGQSAGLSFWSLSKRNGGLGWMMSSYYSGQTVTAIIFAVGMIAATVSNMVSLHRLIPIGLFVALIFCSAYDTIASRALIAGVCLEGIAIISARPVLKLVTLMFILLSLFEVRAVFG